ncbi:OLC1v1005404C1 [Oldenlandia corymbosa var. corymbosa]|uniref:OLC1v1005404C1 n=1 Tax=Oldenlandia corymbosa var. corymbosa TaxID=529605 RepID=A0AAV1DEH4_OLDCO|nr:OLC1v1005404C1 [Oldenlandia corymbosa var. corymbosa]
MHGRVISVSYHRGSPAGHKSKDVSQMGQIGSSVGLDDVFDHVSLDLQNVSDNDDVPTEDIDSEGFNDFVGDSPPHSPPHSSPARRINVIRLRVRGLGAASASASSSAASNAQPWVVMRPVVDGPHDGSVIPSFLGHVAHRLMDKSYKPSLEMDTRVTYFKLLKEWKGSMSTEAQILLVVMQNNVINVSYTSYGPDPVSDDPRTIYSGWIQYRDIIEPYLPSRVLRQIGYIQVIPPPIPHPLSANRSGNHHAYKVSWRPTEAFDVWMQFPFSTGLDLEYFEQSDHDKTACAPNYLQWYLKYSHPFLVLDATTIGGVRTTSHWVNQLSEIHRNALETIREIDAERVKEHKAFFAQFQDDFRLSHRD